MSNQKQSLTPTAVNKYLKTILEKDKFLISFYIKGEISNLKYHSNGNMYFSIKDNNASISCIMFANAVKLISFKVIEGDKVQLQGAIYLYVKAGQYNINVKAIEKIGMGDLYLKYEELKKNLLLLGYFDQENKQNIPRFPQTIGVITSQTGAAIQDIITTIKRRYPICQIIVFPTTVQGTKGTKEIVDNIFLANQKYQCDVLIVGRGGGSIEDLWNFNEEEVVKAVYESKIPIISSVGHETDTTLIDLVADMRAPTPTAAAEIATPNIDELNQIILTNKNKMIMLLKNKIESNNLKLNIIEQNQYFLDPLLNKRTSFDQTLQEFEYQEQEIQNIIKNSFLQISNLKKELNSAVTNKINITNKNIEYKKELLDYLNPLTILSKGYSISKVDGKVIKSINQLKTNDSINIMYSDGHVEANIKAIKEKNE